MNCAKVEARWIDLMDKRLDVAEELRIHDHLESCPACRERAATWQALVPVMRGLAPPPLAPLRLRRMELDIERSVRAAAERAEGPHLRLRWLAAAAAVVTLVVSVAWLRGGSRTHNDSFASIAAVVGDARAAEQAARPGARIQAGAELAVPRGAELALALARGTSLRLLGPARAVLAGDPRHVQVRLQRGRLDAVVAPRAAGETFSVDLPEGRVEVRGTRFTVTAEPGGSWVEVVEGHVVAVSRDGAQHPVGTSERFVFAAPNATAAHAQAPPATAVTPREAPRTDDAPTAAPAPRSTAERAPARGREPRCDLLAREARTAMRAHKTARALALLDAGGARPAGPPGCLDELRYLRAEALRLEGRLEDAVASYRALGRAGAPPAMRQNALFAAAQLEQRLGRFAAARADYENALGAAPKGALREEAMLGAMDAAVAAGDGGSAAAAARRYLASYPNGLGAARARQVEERWRR